MMLTTLFISLSMQSPQTNQWKYHSIAITMPLRFGKTKHKEAKHMCRQSILDIIATQHTVEFPDNCGDLDTL
jgi:hypothetical protein